MQISQDKLRRIKTPFLKRFFDAAFSLAAMIIFAPFFVFIFFCLLAEHILRFNLPMPFYAEKRVSAGREFRLVKFNPFKPDLVRRYRREGKYFYTKGMEQDRRNLTLAGLVLQRSYLDELPQLFAVLSGRMTLVGPRPVNLAVHRKNLDDGIITKEIFSAGLTGPFQSRKGEAGMDQHDLDMAYIEFVRTHGGLAVLWQDLKIIGRTIKILIKAKGY